MTNDLDFVETDATREVPVSPAELRALRRAQHGLVVEDLGDGRARVGPRQGMVGTVLLPSGRRIVVRPKVRLDSLSELLALAYRTMAPPASAGAAAVEDATPTDWLLLQLTGEVEALLAHGLRRGYVERRELLPFVRGRMRPPLNPSRLPMVDCEFADFVLDPPENRLLRGALELVAPAARNPYVRARLRDALAAFGNVALMRPSTSAFDRVRVTRLNAHYQPALRLARLALEGAGVEDAAGAETAPAYFVPMWRVWEEALASAISDAGVRRLHAQPEFGDRFVQLSGTPKLRITLRPDLLVGSRVHPSFAVDLKWAPPLALRHGKRRVRNEHLYQLATYCSALGCDGMLVYPRFDDRIESVYEFEGRRLYLQTVDLSLPTLADLRRVADRIASLAGVGQVAAAA